MEGLDWIGRPLKGACLLVWELNDSWTSDCGPAPGKLSPSTRGLVLVELYLRGNLPNSTDAPTKLLHYAHQTPDGDEEPVGQKGVGLQGVRDGDGLLRVGAVMWVRLAGSVGWSLMAMGLWRLLAPMHGVLTEVVGPSGTRG